jgi:hypothetical protein
MEHSPPQYDEKLEALAESILRERLRAKTSLGVVPADPSVENLAYEMALVKFARQKRISLFERGWRTITEHAAAREYLLGRANRRPLGRPSKPTRFGLLQSILPKEDAELQAVEHVKSEAARGGRKLSDAKAIAFIVAFLKWNGEVPRGGSGAKIYKSQFRQFANKVSNQRTLTGKNLRPKRVITKK